MMTLNAENVKRGACDVFERCKKIMHDNGIDFMSIEEEDAENSFSSFVYNVLIPMGYYTTFVDSECDGVQVFPTQDDVIDYFKEFYID